MAVLPGPFSASHFLVDLGDGATARGFAQVVFPEFSSERPGLSGDPLILRRAATGGLELYRWWDESRTQMASSRPVRIDRMATRAPNALRDVRVMLMPPDHAEPLLTWRFVSARPVSLGYSALDANSPSILFETVTLAFERLEME